MPGEDDFIRMQAEALRQAQAAQLQAKQQQTAEAQTAAAALEATNQRNAAQVLFVCGRFATWASENHIKKNSPSEFAHGWLLGNREGAPYWSFSGYGVQDSGGSNVSLLVTAYTHRVREIVVYSATKPGAKNHLFSRKPALHAYPLESIYESIAQFSFQNQVEWRGLPR